MSTQNLHIAGAAYDASNEKLKSASTAAIAAGTSYVAQIFYDLVRLRSFRKAERELNALDDRMLRDIGLDRSEIKSALMNARNERVNGWTLPGKSF